ncbi:hypothetical protein SAMN05444673_0375 [Bacillus sp. OV166]|nr:hypothetical protein SAMN05444673_0375 [Bacillus sp. OV166]
MIKRVVIYDVPAIQGWWEPETEQIMKRTFEMCT